jgi:hypothetical protein
MMVALTVDDLSDSEDFTRTSRFRFFTPSFGPVSAALHPRFFLVGLDIKS